MKNEEFNELLLRTAFSCMACDGDIDPQEINLILELENKEKVFEVERISEKLQLYLNEINEKGHGFFKHYFKDLSQSDLSEDQDEQIVEVAIKIIEADNIIQYSELKFFKIIHSFLNITTGRILERFSHIEDIEDYVAQDIISKKYVDELTTDYFESQQIPQFKMLKDIDGVNLN